MGRLWPLAVAALAAASAAGAPADVGRGAPTFSGGGAPVGAGPADLDRRIHVTMFSDRELEAAGALEALCRNAAEPARLVVHVVRSAAGAFDRAHAPSCAAAEVRVHALPRLADEIRASGLPVSWELGGVARTGLTVRVADWDASGKHKTGFNHLRFYMPYLSPFKDLSSLVFLDDDTIVQGDVAALDALDLGGAVVGAGCQNWVWNSCERMESSYALTYADVPYFGFGTLGDRTAEAATCRGDDDRECVPAGLLASIENASVAIHGEAGRMDLAGFRARRAWNFGLNKFDLDAWRRRNATQLYLCPRL